MMLGAIAANLISWLIIAALIAFIAGWRVLLRWLWVELWADWYPDAADALRYHYADEIDVPGHFRAMGRALLFMVAVPAFARAQAQAERHARTRTASVIER